MARKMIRWMLEKLEINCEMGSSGITLGNMLRSCVQPKADVSLASSTHTESMLSVGTMRMSATTTWSPL